MGKQTVPAVTERAPRPGPGARRLSQHTGFYLFVTSAASALDPRTAARNACEDAGGGTPPVSTERKVTSPPYIARMESSSGRTSAPFSVRPANAPFARE